MSAWDSFGLGMAVGLVMVIGFIGVTGSYVDGRDDVYHEWACVNAYRAATTEADSLRIQLGGCPAAAEIHVPTLTAPKEET